MRKYIKLILVSMLAFAVGCADYLDIVPDKTEDVALLFEQRETAYRALATCYHYLPVNDGVYSCEAMASDELTVNFFQGGIPGRDIMRGLQSPDNPLMGYWSTTHLVVRDQESMWRGIYACNVLIENIDLVYDMTEREIAQWKAEAIFLKAYYHYLMFAQYGPIPIMDENIPIAAPAETMRVKRQPVDSVVKYIVNTMDLALSGGLTNRITNALEYGRIDQVIASSIKARVLLMAASPLFNGNREYYENFKDKDGIQLFNLEEDPAKWEKAANAALQAIRLAEDNGARMYYYDSLSVSDSEDARWYANPNYHNEIAADYSYRFMFYDPWNSETLWGDSYPTLKRSSNIYHSLQAAAMPMDQASTTNSAAWNWAVPTYEAVEAYYTSNGLPIDEDITYRYATRFAQTITSDRQDSLHIAASGGTTYRTIVPYIHTHREPRFYASIGFDQSYYRTWGTKWILETLFGFKNGRKTLSTKDYSVTGYLLKKPCHPQSNGSAYSRLIVYPWPIIRLAELYLIYAEAQNEFSGPSQEIYDALNMVRRRAGIPDVEVVWSDATLAKTVNKHTTKAGLRDIIRQERRIELAFEGQRNYDVRRWKEGEKYFDIPVRGWNTSEEDRQRYFNSWQGPVQVMARSFVTPRDYLYPIKTEELTKNSNLVQNPGW
jgi:hypothetical protein